MTQSLALGAHHASAVAFDDFGILILGKTGSGKSELALGLIDKGAKLIADDLVLLENDMRMRKPYGGPDLIEIRQVGLFHAPMADAAALQLVVDMELEEDQRLPPLRHTRIGDRDVVLIAGKGVPNLEVILKHYLAYGRDAPE